MPLLDAGDGADSAMDSGAPDAGFDAGIPCEGPPGLYVDSACTLTAAGVLPYTPRFRLWSDATIKDRFIAFPPGIGVQIDTRDADAWVYPVGTRIWKNFSLAGTKLETRLLEKTRPGTGFGNWTARTFRWSENQVEVTEVVNGAIDVLGTHHDIPAVRLCGDCHNGGGQPDGVLGFGSIQLAHGETPTSLQDLDDMGLLSQAVPAALGEVPGSSTDQAALGYLHANCGHCHGQIAPKAGMVLYIETGLATLESTGAYRTTVGVASNWSEMGSSVRVVAGSASTSTLFQRMGVRGPGDDQMPPLATDMTDPAGLQIVESWIDSL